MNQFHNNPDESILDGELKRLQGDVNWHTMRQQKLKRSLLNNLESRPINYKRFTFLSDKLKAPIAGVCLLSIVSLLLYLSVFDEKNLNNVDSIRQVETPNEVIYPFEITTDLNAKIDQIKNMGFELKLPTLSLSEDMILRNVVPRNINGTVEVTTSYLFDSNKEFRITQDAFDRNLKSQYAKRFSEIKLSATESFFINGFPAYVVEKGDNSYITSIYVLTDNYSYVIHSGQLNTEKLKLLFESMGIE
jgi:hypothetical protein